MTSLHRPSPSRKSPKLTAHGGPKALAAPATSAIKDVYRQDQPHGEDGIRFSLKRVCMMIAEGRLHPDVRAWTTKKLAAVGNPKGAKARAKALLEAVRAQSGWVPDPIDAEFMAGAHLTLGDGDKPPYFALGDCFPEGTLVLSDKHELVPIETLGEGMKIWGLDRWSTVQRVGFKGTLAVDAILLNNGSDLKLTPDHHVYVLDCTKHAMLEEGDDPKALPEDRHWRGGSEKWGCCCPAADRVEKRIRVADLREGMVLPTPDRIPFGTTAMDPDRAWIEGLYVADGWSENYRFAISGKDGCPKEEQKRGVQAACERLGIHTRWHERYIAVNDADWALRMQQMGGHAPEKHLLSINLDEGSAAATLRGVMADSGQNTRGKERTFTSTSRLLAIQTRVLHRMFGITCGWRFIEDHRGLGKNPIYRLGTRGNVRNDGRATWLLRVKQVDRNVAEMPCWDITTDDHRVYLPEHDVTVSQCDDLTIALGSAILAPLMYLTAAGSVGTRAAVVGHAYGTDRNIEHVLGAIFDPNDNKWYYVDPSLKDMPFGECRPFTRERVYLVPSAELLCDDRVCLAPGGRSSGPPPMPRRGDFVAVNGAPGMDLVEPPSWVDGVPNIDGRPDENETLVSQTDLTGILEATVTFAPPETAAQIENEALFQLWQDLEPCGAENPLHWCDINPPASTDYAAQELYQPWHDGIEPYSGASWLIPNSGFLPK